MSISREQIIATLFESIEEINKQLDRAYWLSTTPELVILGADETGMDSLAFLNFVVLVEEKFEQRFGKNLVLTGDHGVAYDLFATVDTLATHIENLIAR